jgi:hypothetical protein
MKLKTAIIVLPWLCFAQPIYGLLSGSGATQSGDASQTTSSASAKQYKLGETIHLREGVTLKIVPGSSKSVELFASHGVAIATSYVLDLEFELRPGDAEALMFVLGKGVDKSDVFLNSGPDKIMPSAWGFFPGSQQFKPSVGSVDVEDGLHVGPILEGKARFSFLFELSGDQLKQKKKLALNFTFLPKERWSFVIDLDSKGN